VGCCVGLRSIRSQNISKELNGEKLDIIQWHPDTAIFIANALSPASVVKVDVNEEEKSATVVVPDKQLSLAIGKGGQNARLAARLTGWRIDIKNLSMVETGGAGIGEVTPSEVLVTAEPAEVLEPQAEAERVHIKEAATAESMAESVLETPIKEEISITEEIEEQVATPVEVKTSYIETTPSVVVEATPKGYSFEQILSEIEAATQSIQGRFSEEAPLPKGIKPDSRLKKGKQKGIAKSEIGGGEAKPKKARRQPILEDED
jgi:N utilization substance protein A